MTKAQELRGKCVVLTGASSGIGRIAAYAFAAHGAHLVLASRDEAALTETADECRRLGGEALVVVTDVTRGESVQALAGKALEQGGRIDIWINNAGVGSVGGFEETPLEAHEQVVQTDLLGYLRGAHAVLPQFKSQGQGILINTLSVGSWVAQPYAASYSAAKFGLVGLTEALRGELVDWPDIHVCNLYPAVIDTPGFRDGGNYTGHRLTPPSPIYNPERVALAMVELACRPCPTKVVGGAAHLLRIAHFLTPGFTRILGWGTARALGRAPLAGRSSGNLFNPPSGTRQVRGGWKRSGNTRGLLLAGAAIAALGVFMACRHERSKDVGPGR